MKKIIPVSTDPKVKTTVYLPQSVIWLLRERAATEHLKSDSAALEAAVRMWYEQTRPAPKPQPEPIRKQGLK
ncbi:MAG: ribbon-helix-helix protein, CopG family [Bryobacteraceae bacterium]|jgi:hypothetical protein